MKEVPSETVNVPFTVVFAPIAAVTLPAVARLLYVVISDGKVWLPAPPKLIDPIPGVNVNPVVIWLVITRIGLIPTLGIVTLQVLLEFSVKVPTTSCDDALKVKLPV